VREGGKGGGARAVVEDDERGRRRRRRRREIPLFLSQSFSLSPFLPPLSHTTYSDTCLAGGFVLDAAEGRYLRALLGWPAESREKMIFSICLVQVQMWSSLV